MVGRYPRVTDRRGQIILLALVFGVSFLDGVDATIVTITIPQIASDLGTSVVNSSWILNAYYIGLAGFLMVFTRISDSGRIRPVFMCGLAIFGVSSVLCAFVGSLSELLILRFIQGFGASMLGSIPPVVIVRMLPESMRARGFSVYSISIAFSIMAGPLLGGVVAALTTWRWIFIVNIPLCLLLIILGYKRMIRAEEMTGLPDIRSSLFMAGAVGFALFSLENLVSNSLGAYATIVSVVLAMMFGILLLKRLRSEPSVPVLDLAIFHNRELILLLTAYVLSTMVALGMEYILPYYLQISCGMDEMTNALFVCIISIVMIVTAFPTGKLCDRIGCRTPAAVSLLLRLGFSLIFMFILPEWGYIPLIVALATAGLSYGLSGTSQSTRVVQHCEQEYQSEGSAFMSLMYYVGSTLGVMGYAAMFSLSGNGLENAAFLSGDAVALGFHIASVLGVVLSILSLLCTLAVPNKVPKDE